MPRRTRGPQVGNQITATGQIERAVLTPVQLRIWEIIGGIKSEELALIGYGGAAGGGKTRALAELAVDLACDFPGNKILVGRKDYSDLRSTTMEQFDLYCPNHLIVAHNDAEHWRDIRLPEWPEGVCSRVIFRELKDYLGIGSEEYGAVLIDEAGEVPSKSALMLLSRLRWKLPPIVGRKLKYVFVAASNPWPGWFKEWFVDRSLPEDALRIFKGTVHFIPALPKDNPYLPPDYEARLRAVYPADWVKRLMDGRWDAFVGQVYPQFSPTIHQWLRYDIKTKKLQPPTEKEYSRVIGGLDFGGQNPHAHYSAGVAAVVLKSGRLVVVDEFEARGSLVVEEQMQWMLKVQQEWGNKTTGPVRWVGDRSQMLGIKMWRKMGFSIALSKGGPDSVEWGIAMVGRRLDLDKSGLPGIYYLPTLTKFPRRMGAYRYGEPKEDAQVITRNPLKVDDDLADACRYMHEEIDKPNARDIERYYRHALPGINQEVA